MKHINTLIVISILAVGFNSCKSKKVQKAETGITNTQRQEALDEADKMLTDSSFLMEESIESKFQIIAEKNGIRLGYFINSEPFEDAKLKLNFPKNNANLPTGRVSFKYKVDNYELTAHSPYEDKCDCNKSDKGQHIHHILNNNPYEARYTDTFSQVLPEGNYVMLSFLSRSYHEGIKTKDAFELSQFQVGISYNSKRIDLDQPLLFYSRPKGVYKGKDINNLLLDFYITNVNLSSDGYKVEVLIDDKTKFTLTEWRPYVLQGLGAGIHTIRLSLINKDNKSVGSLTEVARKITLEN
ncbi:MAG: hypothetical protein SGJ04_06520 [Bacteroidota bacterium]|nr:hypothetical protein [Bacteroidota bacterium]